MGGSVQPAQLLQAALEAAAGEQLEAGAHQRAVLVEERGQEGGRLLGPAGRGLVTC